MNINKTINILREQEKLKILAGEELARFLNINTEDIFYSYMKNAIPLFILSLSPYLKKIMETMSEKQKIDLSVTDRYILSN